jgi:tetratricopeptide (TPR) repeat protein
MDAEYAHNEFLELLTAFGLIGLVWGLLLLKKLWPQQKPGPQAALAALSTASLFDFCFHTPLIALQGAGLLAPTEKKKGAPSWVSGFLAGGLALGLFGPPALNPSLLEQSQNLQEARKFPEALRCLETAEKLNAWDAGYAVAKADYLERLYRATGDPTWEKLSDEAFDRGLNLEQTDGSIRVDNSERLIRRLSPRSAPEDFEKVELALGVAENAMPFNAFIWDDVGRLYAAQGQNDNAIHCFQKAVELEPNFAGAWFRLGTLLKDGHRPVESEKVFETSLQVYNQWKDADRIADVEKRLVGLPKDEVEWLMRKIKP